MISFKTLHFNTYCQSDYDSDIANINYSKIKCSCGSTGHFHKHALYSRYLSLSPDNSVSISIVRIKCESCNTTHALLPSIIIPYRILSNPCIINIIQSFRYVTDSASVISKITGFSRELVIKLIAFFIKFHKERLSSFLAVFSACVSDSFDFIMNYFSEYHIMFMQRVTTKNMIIFT